MKLGLPKFLFRSNGVLWRPAAGLTPETWHLKPNSPAYHKPGYLVYCYEKDSTG
jgi:hypothetical protein